MEFLELLDFNTVYEATHPGRVMWSFGMRCKPTFIPMTAEEEKVRGMEFDDSVLAIECHERADYKWKCAKCGMERSCSSPGSSRRSGTDRNGLTRPPARLPARASLR
jgi:hypothetical protein